MSSIAHIVLDFISIMLFRFFEVNLKFLKNCTLVL